MELDFTIDDDLTRAHTLPAKTYVDGEWLAIEQRSIFRRTWQLAAFAEHVQHDGDTVATEVAGVPLVVVRDGQALRAFHNVCRHRAGPVAIGCERRKTLQCRYHGWTYALDGRLLRAPEMHGACGFEPALVRLPSVRVAEWGPLVLVCLSDDPGKSPAGDSERPVAEQLAEITDRTRALGFEGLRRIESREYLVECNWKVYVDNYLEGYHLPLVHPELHRELDYERYAVEPRETYSIQHAPFRPLKGDSTERRYVSESDGSQSDAQYYWVFPNLMLNCYLGQLQTNRVLPIAAERTRVLFDWFATEPPGSDQAARRFRRLVDFSHEIQLEDEQICQAVQRGLRSGSYERGRLSAAQEAGVHHFHRRWLDYVSRA